MSAAAIAAASASSAIHNNQIDRPFKRRKRSGWSPFKKGQKKMG